MKRAFSAIAVLVFTIVVAAPLCITRGAQNQNLNQAAAPKPPEPLKLKVGDIAPDFTLLAFDGTKLSPVSLHDFKGKKNVALAFYVFAFTGG